jgi:acetoin utilization protein AcuB
MSIKIKDVMTPSPHTIGEDQTLDFAKHEMAKYGIRHLPVLRAGKCVGLISDRDIKLSYAVESGRAGLLKVTDACSGEVYSVDENEFLRNVAQYMAKNLLGSAVVVDQKEKVVGIFTVTDACRVLGEKV